MSQDRGVRGPDYRGGLRMLAVPQAAGEHDGGGHDIGPGVNRLLLPAAPLQPLQLYRPGDATALQ